MLYYYINSYDCMCVIFFMPLLLLLLLLLLFNLIRCCRLLLLFARFVFCTLSILCEQTHNNQFFCLKIAFPALFVFLCAVSLSLSLTQSASAVVIKKLHSSPGHQPTAVSNLRRRCCWLAGRGRATKTKKIVIIPSKARARERNIYHAS